MSSHPPLIEEILRHNTLEMHFQPITSVRRGAVLGVEALVRAWDRSGQRISPQQLFHAAETQNCLRELDERCQFLALEAFAPLYHAAPEFMLFVNLHAASLLLSAKGATESADGSDDADDAAFSFLQKQARHQKIDPRNIAIEILESRIDSTETLRSATARYRKAGFCVVLDDIGTGDSNLDRITQVQPDMIKSDRSLTHGIANNYYQQEVFKSLVQLSERIGGWVITEGVETREDALTVLDLGGDLLQGYYLGQPQKLPRGGADARAALRDSAARLRKTGTDFRRFAVDKTLRERAARTERLRIARQVRDTLAQVDPASAATQTVLEQALTEFPLIESACLLDTRGIQVTDVFLAHGQSERQRSVVYAPPAKGSDHSLKEYFYLLMEVPLTEYETQPYVPLPNTDLCVTVTLRCRGREENEWILCLHTRVARGGMSRDPAPKKIQTDGSEMPRRQYGDSAENSAENSA